MKLQILSSSALFIIFIGFIGCGTKSIDTPYIGKIHLAESKSASLLPPVPKLALLGTHDLNSIGRDEKLRCEVQLELPPEITPPTFLVAEISRADAPQNERVVTSASLNKQKDDGVLFYYTCQIESPSVPGKYILSCDSINMIMGKKNQVTGKLDQTLVKSRSNEILFFVK